MGWYVLHTISSQTPAEYSTIQFNPDTIYPEVKGLVPQDFRLEVPTFPFLYLINLLEQLTELRETFYLKGYNSGRARQKRCLGQHMGKGGAGPGGVLPALSPLSHISPVHQLGRSQNPVFSGFYEGFITYA